MKEQWIKILITKYAILNFKSTIKLVLTHNLLKNWGAIWKKSLCTNWISYLHCSRKKNLTDKIRHENNNSVISNLGITLRITCKCLADGADSKSSSTHNRIHLRQGLWRRQMVDICLWWADTHWQIWMWREIMRILQKNRKGVWVKKAFFIR